MLTCMDTHASSYNVMDGFGNDVIAEDLAVRDADRYSDDLLKTLQGSYDNIGWLPRTPGMPGVEDGTARFLEFAGIRNGEHTLPSSFVYLHIPGLFSNHGPLYFVGTKKFFSKMGLACHIAKIQTIGSLLQHLSIVSVDRFKVCVALALALRPIHGIRRK
ncbi:hypothetical protein ACE6H2_018833 [Prunus campanulata]